MWCTQSIEAYMLKTYWDRMHLAIPISMASVTLKRSLNSEYDAENRWKSLRRRVLKVY